MSKEEGRTYLEIMRRRYAAVRRKKGRGHVLDEFCGMTGMSRKHAIKALSPGRRPVKRRGCPTGCTGEGAALLARLWKLSDMMCGKLLKAALPALLASLGRREAVPEEVSREILRMSAATIDRRLRGVKAAGGGGSMAGSFVWTLTMTDVATQWTELRAVWNKGAVGVCDAI